MQRRWIIWGFSGWMVACAVNTEPIPGQADQGFAGVGGGGGIAEANDAGATFDAGAPALDLGDGPDAEPTARFDSCDVDLSCSAECPADLDCAADAHGTPPPDEAPAPLSMAVAEADEGQGLRAGEDAWFTWDTALQARALRVTDGADGVPPAALVLYQVEGEAWTAVARAEPDAEGVAPLVIELPDDLDQVPEGATLILRIHAYEAMPSWALVLGG